LVNIAAVKKHIRGIWRTIYHHKNLLTDPLPKLLVPVYHRVLPDADFNPLGTIVGLKYFIGQIESLALRYPIISMADAMMQMREGRAKAKIQVALTFDDGYVDNFQIAFPALKRMGIPAVFFLSSGYVGSGRPLWDWELAKSLLKQNARIGKLRLHGGGMIERGATEGEAGFLLRLIMELKKQSAQDRYFSIKSIYEQTGTQSVNEVGDRCMNWDEISEMLSSGMEVGAHGVTHQSLAWLPHDEAVREIRDGGSAVEKNTGAPCRHFAFPFGSPSDFNEGLIGEVKAAGYESCQLNLHGYNHVEAGAFALKRIIMSETIKVGHILG
jgi:peptidoglycan/xylan/chitin deacetylase (PgdA/CDA1 family)